MMQEIDVTFMITFMTRNYEIGSDEFHGAVMALGETDVHAAFVAFEVKGEAHGAALQI